jgi:hypothetical protein
VFNLGVTTQTQSPVEQLFSMLLGQSPLIGAYVVGLVICSMRWSRYPRPAQIAFLGTTFLLIETVGAPLVLLYVAMNIPDARSGDLKSFLAFAGGIVRGTGYAFLLGAAYFGRSARAMTRTATTSGAVQS